MQFRVWLESIQGFNNMHRQFLNDFMESNRNMTLLSVYADFLQDQGNPLGDAIRLVSSPRTAETHDSFYAIVNPLLGLPSQYHLRTVDIWQDKSNRYVVANFNLNEKVNPLSASYHERNRYWRANVPPNGIVYQYNVKPNLVSMYNRPSRTPNGQQRKDRISFSDFPLEPREIHITQLPEVPFSSLPDEIAAYFFLIALVRLYWHRT
jgi:hypothetical protein